MPLALTIGLRYTFNAKRNKSQLVSFLSGVSIGGLVLGVGLLITVLSVMNGFDRELREKILGLVPQAVITHKEGISNWKSLSKQLETSSEIKATAPYIQTYGLIAKGKKAEPAVIYAIDGKLEARVSLIGDYIGDEALTALNSEPGAIILGADLAAKLNTSVNKRVMVVVPGQDNTQQAAKTGYFSVLAIVKTQTELDASLALISISAGQKFLPNPNTVSGIRLSLNNIFNAPYVVYQSASELGPGFSGTDWTRTHGNLHHAIKMSKNLVGLLMSLIVAIAAFNVVATLILVVVEKQGDIAILRTMGLTTRQVMSVFVVQGTFIGFIGTVLGIVFGCGLALVAQDLVQAIESVFGIQFLKSDVYPLTYLPSEILLADILRVCLTALGLCFVATLYPAYKASRVQPAQALRYE